MSEQPEEGAGQGDEGADASAEQAADEGQLAPEQSEDAAERAAPEQPAAAERAAPEQPAAAERAAAEQPDHDAAHPPRDPRQRRLVAVAGALVAVALAVLAVTVLTRGGDDAPVTGAARLVPAGALIYLHVSTDRGRDGTTRALNALGRFSIVRTLTARLIGSLNATGNGVGVDYDRDVAPWIGRDAALALLDEGGAVASSEIVVGVRDQAGAREFLGRLGGPGAQSRYRGVSISAYGSQALAFVDGYLVLGPLANVRAAIDRAQGRGRSLAADPVYRRAAGGAPAGRFVDAYASAEGVRRVLGSQGGVLGALGALLAQPGLQGTQLSFTVAGARARLRIHSALTPPTAATVAARSRPFRATLAGIVGTRAMVYLDVTGLASTIPRLVAAARAARATSGLGPLLFSVGAELTRQGVGLRGKLAPLFAGESAIALMPGAAGARPSLLLLARVRDQAAARTTMAELQARLAATMLHFGGASTIVPTFNQRTVAGVTAYQVLAGGLELDYALHRGLLAMSTSLGGLASALGGSDPLAARSDFKGVTRGAPDAVTSVLFLDLPELLALGERTGLARDPTYQAIRGDLGRVRAVGLVSTGGESDSTTELFLLIP